MKYFNRIARQKFTRAQTLRSILTGAVIVGLLAPTRSLANLPTHYDIIAMPDFLNQDVGDVSGSPYYQPGMPNSINNSYRTGLDFVLDHVESEGIRDISMAGDFVEGHWGVDSRNTGVFGPVGTYKEKLAAYKLAASTYYPQTRSLFTSRDFRVFPSIGDHEIWDNNWYRESQLGYPFSVKAFSSMKNQYVKYMMRNTNGSMPDRFKNRPTTGSAQNTAYAYRPHPEVQLVSLDQFQKKDGSVVGSIGKAQLDWLRGVLNKANRDDVDWIIVQGHLPILNPVRYRHSSNMYYANGAQSALWQLMTEQRVDLYLNGEVHDTTLRHKNGITQLSNGGLFKTGKANYATIKIRGSLLYISVKEFNGKPDSTTRLWQTDIKKEGPGAVTYSEAPSVIGTAKLNKHNTVLSRTGKLTPYNP